VRRLRCTELSSDSTRGVRNTFLSTPHLSRRPGAGSLGRFRETVQAPQLRLFGTPALIRAAGDEVLLPERLTQLAIALAARSDWVKRDQLVALLWPELNDQSARRNLRKLLFRARKQPWLARLEVRPDAVRWSVESDLRAFTTACEKNEWAHAVAAYGGLFCEGFEHKAAEPFAEWLRFERNRLASLFRAAAVQRMVELAGDAGARERLSRRWLTCEPLDEDALISLTEVLRAQRREAEARHASDLFAQRLRHELDVEPSTRVRALAEGMRSPSGAPPPQADPGFVGRRAELLQAQALLERPECRLLTITGPGGIGKSRLAKHLLGQQRTQCTALWIALDDVADASQALSRIAVELGLAAKEDVLQTVCAHLQTTAMVLVLDNCEHLLGLPRMIERLLAETKNLKICATSRVRLGARAEWLLPLSGLSLSTHDATVDRLHCDAAQLFVACARASKPDFDPTVHASEIAAVVRAVGGLPLAILLAAHWTRLLPVAEIRAELDRSLDVLASAEEGEERPEHRSVRATFEQSWRLLASPEQRTLAGLSVFVGAFTREAARHVADASWPLLASLADKSLLQIDPGQCSLHPLVRQYAAERMPDQIAVAARRHSEYFCNELESMSGYVRDDEQRVVATIGAHLGDSLLAVSWARSHARFDLLDSAVWTLAQFFFLTGRASEGLGALGAVPPLSAAPSRLEARTAAQHADGRARLLYRLGRLEEAAESAHLCYRYSRLAGDGEGVRVALSILASIAAKQGRLNESRRYSQHTLRLSERANDEIGEATSLLNLGKVEADLGSWNTAAARFQRALELNKANGNQLGVIAALNNLGTVHLEAGHAAEALIPLEDGLKQVDATGLVGLRSEFVSNLARTRFALGNLPDARAAAEEVAVTSRLTADPGNVADCFVILARLALGESRIAAAKDYFVGAARVAADTQHLRAQMRCLLAGVEVLLALNRHHAANVLAARILASPLASRAEALAACAWTTGATATALSSATPELRPTEALADVIAEISQ
jgi:predicted ATPase/DNA-binding SARP family transcriptional activator/tetratricopeptide (TPR) repeat protein